MTPERVLQHPPLALAQRERERYFEDGFLTVPGYVGVACGTTARGRRRQDRASRALTASEDQFDLAPITPREPNIRRCGKQGISPELGRSRRKDRRRLVADLLGPDVPSQLEAEFKWSEAASRRWPRHPGLAPTSLACDLRL